MSPRIGAGSDAVGSASRRAGHHSFLRLSGSSGGTVTFGKSNSGTKAGLTTEQTVAIRQGRGDFDPKLAALLAVVREVAARVGEVSDTTWKNALESGWSDAELTESFAHVAVNMYTNYFNHMAGTELDIPAAPGIQG